MTINRNLYNNDNLNNKEKSTYFVRRRMLQNTGHSKNYLRNKLFT